MSDPSRTAATGADAFVLAVCAAMHAAVDGLLLGEAWVFNEPILALAIGVPLSQCSLVALWAAKSRANLLLRFVAPLVGAILCWYILSRLLVWAIGEPASAAWAVLIGLQTVLVVIWIQGYQRLRPHHATDDDDRLRFAFDLRVLILWTMAAAIVLAVVRYGCLNLQWTTDVVDWEYFDVMPILGVYNALLAVHWLWALAGGSLQMRVAKTAFTALALAATLVLVHYVVDKMVVGTVGITLLELSMLTLSQSFLIATTLAVVLVATRRQDRVETGHPMA